MGSTQDSSRDGDVDGVDSSPPENRSVEARDEAQTGTSLQNESGNVDGDEHSRAVASGGDDVGNQNGEGEEDEGLDATGVHPGGVSDGNNNQDERRKRDENTRRGRLTVDGADTKTEDEKFTSKDRQLLGTEQLTTDLNSNSGVTAEAVGVTNDIHHSECEIEDDKPKYNPTIKINSPTVASIPTMQTNCDDAMQRGNRSERSSSRQDPDPEAHVYCGQLSINSAVPTVVAELVTLPVEAVRVSIDEEPIHELDASLGSGRAHEQYPLNDGGQKHGPWLSVIKRKYSLGESIIIALVVLGVICAITIPVVLLNKANSDGDTYQSMGAPTQPPTPPYPCYNSTANILRAQMSNDVLPEAFIICPNTVIKLGTLKDPSADEFAFVDGDYPLIAIRENVTIQCGIDGRRENNCTLDGGFLQVLTLQQVPSPNDGSWIYIDTPLNNFSIRGITFTGRLTNAPPFASQSVMLSHPARDVRFEDCSWVNITTSYGLIGVYRNNFQVIMGLPLDDHSIHATFSDCTFDGIIYDSPMIFVVNQSITVERTIFRDFRLSMILDHCRSGNDIGGIYGEEEMFVNSCAALLYCGPGASCDTNEICVYGLEYDGPSIFQVTSTSDFYHDRLFANLSHSEVCELSLINLNDESSNCTDLFTLPNCPLRLSS